MKRGQASLEAMLAFACLAMLVAVLCQPIAGISRKALEARQGISGSAVALKCASMLDETHSTNAIFSGQQEECVVENNLVKGKGSGQIGIGIIGNARMVENGKGQQIEVEASAHYE